MSSYWTCTLLGTTNTVSSMFVFLCAENLLNANLKVEVLKNITHFYIQVRISGD